MHALLLSALSVQQTSNAFYDFVVAAFYAHIMIVSKKERATFIFLKKAALIKL